MFYIIAGLAGVLIAVMLVPNGVLSGAYGMPVATVVIHATGLALIVLLWLAGGRKSMKPAMKLPFYYFSGGVIGIATTVCNLLAFGKISTSALLGLGLLGQSLASLAVDHFGLFGMQKQPFKTQKLAGVALVGGGIAMMLLF